MKGRLARRLVMVAFLALVAAPLAAQGGLKLGGGVTLPQGDYADEVKNGWHGMAAFAFGVPGPLGVRVDAAYHLSPFDLPADVDANSAIIALGGDLQLGGGDAGASPYLLAGFTWASAKCSGDACPFETSEEAWGYNVGAGFDMAMLFAEIRYVQLQGDLQTSFVPITIGFRF